MNLVGQNVGPTQPLTVGQPIEVAFDRLLAPSSITRQTFVLQDLFGDFIEVTPSYDPVSRVVRLCYPDSPALQTDQTYKLTLLFPQNAQDPNGVHAIDGAPLAAGTAAIEFQVASGGAYTGPDQCVQQPTVDFCGQVLPIFSSKCGTSICHSGSFPAAGLLMTTPAGIQSTAIARAAQGDNNGTISAPEPPGTLFGVDMAIVDPTAPSDSWLMYKLLLASPPACSSTPGTGCDAGAPGVVFNRYPTLTPAWSPISSDERATLANYVPGREMPFPVDPSASLDSATSPLTVDELDTVSTWIAQGAAIPAGGCAQ